MIGTNAYLENLARKYDNPSGMEVSGQGYDRYLMVDSISETMRDIWGTKKGAPFSGFRT